STSGGTPTNTFQTVLVSDGNISFVIFNYGEITWTKPLNVGAVFVKAGVNAGDGTHYFSLPGSGTAAIADLQNSTNVGTTGRWLFRVDGETGTCQDEFGQSISAPAHFYPYGTGVGDFIIRKRDTQSSGQFSASTPFVLYGTSYNKLWVNMDGMITFADGTSYHSIEPFPYSDPVVAALVEDVDTSVNVDGRVFYRQTTDTDILQRATNDVADRTGFTATWVFIATWQNVTYYDGDNDSPRNTFQVVMISDGDTSYVIFNYREINWTIGADSDMHAVGGVNAGDGTNYISLPGSGTATFGNLQNTTNDGTNGRWHFRVDCENNTICIAPVQLSPTLPYGSPLPLYAFFSTSSVIPNLTLRFPITTLRFLQHQFGYPQPYLTVPHYHSTLSSAPVQLSPTLPYGSPLPLYAFFSTSSVIPNLTLRFPITTLRFLQHQFSYPQPYLTVPHYHSTLSSAPVQLSPTLPYGSPLPLYAFFSTSSVIPNLTLRFPITTLRFLQHQFSYPQLTNLTLRFPITTLRFLQHQFSYPQPYLTVPQPQFPLPLYAFFSTSSVIPNLTLRFPITTLRFLQHQFGYPQPYLTVPHYHSTLSSAPVRLSPTLPYGSPLPLYAFFSTSSVIPNLTLRFPITTLRFLQHQFSYPQPYLTVPHYHSTLSSAPVQLSPTLPYGSPLPLYAFFSTSSVIPNLTLRFPITTLRFLQHQFSYPQPYLTVPHYHSTLSSAPVQLSPTLPYGSPLPLYAFFSTSSVIPNLTLRFPITTLRFLQHQFSYPQPYLTVPHYHSTLSSAPVQLSPTLPYGSPLPLYAFFSTSSVIP
ncbi:hypothetical protein LSAT2_013036, partial [Lamellibrachia satsuma]